MLHAFKYKFYKFWHLTNVHMFNMIYESITTAEIMDMYSTVTRFLVTLVSPSSHHPILLCPCGQHPSHPPTWMLSRKLLICFLSRYIIFHFLEFYIDNIIRYAFSFSGFFKNEHLWDSSTWNTALFWRLNSILLCGYNTVCLAIHLLMGVRGDFSLRLLQSFVY